MKIETRFNEGDKVFYLSTVMRKIYEGYVRFPIEIVVNINIDGKDFTMTYCNLDIGILPNVKCDMSQLFSTKQELLDSL
jgi:hypothetical protein